MTDHNKRQLIPVVPADMPEPPPGAIPHEYWFLLFEAARKCNVDVHVHLDETSYHAEEALRIWAGSKNLKLAEIEQENRVTGDRYLNLELQWQSSETWGRKVVIYKIRELLNISGPEDDDLGHDDERGAYADGAPPDSNEILGLSQDINRDGWR